MLLLAGDVGGTKTELALYSVEGGPRKPLAQTEFPSANFASLEAIVKEFLANVGHSVDRACFGVAGPVIAGHAKITNLPWEIDEATSRQELGFKAVRLVNDLEAIARAVPILTPDDIHTLNPGAPSPGGTVAVIAPGTGLGEAFLTWDGSAYRAHASEGGHADFAPSDGTQIALLQYLRRRYDHVSYERVCSGIGIPNIYEYLSGSGFGRESPEFDTRIYASPDPTRLILDAALHSTTPSPLCVATLNIFIDILGAEAGNLALKVLATGGVYLAGGIPAHVLAALKKQGFLQAFQRKGRLADLLANVPVHVIVCRAAIIGAAIVGLDLAQESGHTPVRRT
jgi:glucokinase